MHDPSKGEAGTGNIVEAVRHLRSILGDIKKLGGVPLPRSCYGWAKELHAPLELVEEVAERGELPVPLFCAGGIATPADAALVMQLGAEAVFVGRHLQERRTRRLARQAIVEATAHYDDADIVAQGLGASARPCARRRHARREAWPTGLVKRVTSEATRP